MRSRSSVSGFAAARRPASTSGRPATLVVEFTFVVPVFFIFLFGIVEIGRGCMVKSLMTNAARSGCRAGILQGTTNSDVTTAVASALGDQSLRDVTTTVTVNGAVADVSTAQPGDVINVTVSVPVSRISWLPTIQYFRGSIAGSFSLAHG
jgi:Flp pilus assembly protein TadG